MLHLARMFGTGTVKGIRNYIDTQKKYEIMRTILYFGLSLGLFVTGYVTTKTKTNLLTIVAVVGCLPACKSLVNAIMFLRYRSCPSRDADLIDASKGILNGLYDLVFTSYQKNYVVDHLTVWGSNICGYSHCSDFPEKEFQAHLEGILRADGHKNYTIKIFRDLKKYTDRLEQLQELDADPKYAAQVIDTLKSVTL